MDVGEMFLKSTLHPDLKPFAGLDTTPIKSRLDKEGWYQEKTRVWECYAKNFKGLTESPYWSLQLLIHVTFIDNGERKDALNPFQWSHAKMNLPVDESYISKLLSVMKVRSDGHLASEVFIYVDDSRIIAHPKLVCWQAAKNFLSICNSQEIHYI